MAGEIHSTRLFRIETDPTLWSSELFCQTIWYKPEFYNNINELLPDALVCEVSLTDCARFWEAKILIRNLIEGTTSGTSKDSTKKRFRVIQGLLSGQRVVDNRPCQLRVNSQYELVFAVEGREDSSESSHDGHLAAVVDIWKLRLHPANDRSLPNMWKGLLNNAIKQINFVEESNSKLMEQLRENDVRVGEMTTALTRMTAEEREKELLDQFSVVLNAKKKKIRKLLKLLKNKGVATDEMTEEVPMVVDEIPEKSKTTKRKAAPKRAPARRGRNRTDSDMTIVGEPLVDIETNSADNLQSTMDGESETMGL